MKLQVMEFEYWNMIDPKYQWLAKDADGIWYFHNVKPELYGYRWSGFNKIVWKLTCPLNTELLPEVAWEQSLISRPEGITGNRGTPSNAFDLIDDKWEWLAKDVDNIWYFYASKPETDRDSWNSSEIASCLREDLMPDVAWSESLASLSGLRSFEYRLNKEKDELGNRLEKLRTFLKGKIFEDLSMDEQGRLMYQVQVMTAYYNVLKSRLANVGLVSRINVKDW